MAAGAVPAERRCAQPTLFPVPWSAHAQVDEYVARRSEHERELALKLAALLNSKKAKLRELRAEVEALKAQLAAAGGGGGSPCPSAAGQAGTAAMLVDTGGVGGAMEGACGRGGSGPGAPGTAATAAGGSGDERATDRDEDEDGEEEGGSDSVRDFERLPRDWSPQLEEGYADAYEGGR